MSEETELACSANTGLLMQIDYKELGLKSENSAAMPRVKTLQSPELRAQRNAKPRRPLNHESSGSQKTSPQQSLKYVLTPPPTEPMYIPLRDGLVLHEDVELWVNEEVQSKGVRLSSTATGSPDHDYAQGRTGLVEEFSELDPPKRVPKWPWYGWPSICSGLAVVGIGMLVMFYLQKYK